MIKALAFLAIGATALVAPPLAAEPIKLKLSFFSSDRSTSYLAAVKPFTDAVNAEVKDLMEIVLFASGTLGKDLTQQPQLVLDGTADMAYVVTGLTPGRFPDNGVVELPGLFANVREATIVFTRLIAANALRGYEDFFVIGAYVTEPETIHSRPPITNLDDLKGKRIRVNNPGEAAALLKLEAVPVSMPVNKIAEALSGGDLDAATVSTSPLSDYGIGRIATYHYLLQTSGAPLMLLMNRKVFEGLPMRVQDAIRRFSGVWAAERFIENHDVVEREIMVQLRADPQRKVIAPTRSDLDRAQAVFKSVTDEWVAKSPHNRELLDKATKELVALRAMR